MTIPRAPIVVIMGHIDHGKSTLLDYIRKESLTLKEAGRRRAEAGSGLAEAGGITQHISAYEAEVSVGSARKENPDANQSGPQPASQELQRGEPERRRIIFLDTPGHEAFCSARESGTRVADIAVLVVSAEDGVMPQTIEAIERVRKDGIPFIVAINKIDKPNANIDKTKQGLAEAEVLVEGWGGTVPSVLISAKSGEGVDELLETILLQADLEGLSGDPSVPASGFVLESNRHSKKGISGTLIIKNGTLKKGMFVTANIAMAPVRIMENFQGNSVETASLSTPVNIIGWDQVPEAGVPFNAYNSRQEAEKALKNYLENTARPLNSLASLKQDEALLRPDGLQPASQELQRGERGEGGPKLLPIIIKADALGSLRALEHELLKLNNDRIAVKIIFSGLGPINESDVKLALSSKEILLVGFHVKVDNAARDLGLRHNVAAKTFDVIYELALWVGKVLKERTPKEKIEEITGTAKIIRIFSTSKTRQIIGGVVESGEIQSGETVRIMRREAPIGEGKIKELQAAKVKTNSITEGKEFGMMIDSKVEIVPGDRISAYKITNK